VSGRNVRLALIVAAGAVLIVLSTVGPYVDYLWYESIGYGAVFTRVLLYRGLLFSGTLAVTVTTITYHTRRALRARKHFRVYRAGSFIERLNLPDRFDLTASIAAVVLGVGLGGTISARLNEFLLFVYGGPWGVKDPLFGLDLSFFMFRLPFIRSVSSVFLSILLLAGLGAIFVYVLTGAILPGRSVWMEPVAISHLSGLTGAFLVVLAVNLFLAGYQVLYSPGGVVFGATYADARAVLPTLRLLSMAVALFGVLLLLSPKFARAKKFYRPAAVFLSLAVLARLLYPELVQRLYVAPDEARVELPYIQYHIDFTRSAYALDRIREYEFRPEQGHLPDISSLEKVRLWDWRVLQDTFNQLQRIRPYYKFADTDVDRYEIDGEKTLVFLSARELDTRRLDESARTWVNLALKYTHGYGVVLAKGSGATVEGLPQFLVKDVPPVGTGALQVTRPEIYYGELTNDYVIVMTREKEFDYPFGETNALTVYQGKGGVPVGSILRRSALAIRFGTYKILISPAITPDSRIMFRRNVKEMAAAAMPFATFDNDPYVVLLDGRLVYIIDGYTTSSHFPYAQPSPAGFNYIRNSVKAVVDAYDGSVVMYVTDPSDPVMRAYAAAFPGILKSAKDVPPALEAHFRYPVDLFMTQARMYVTYHMKDASVFYNKEDMWAVPQELYYGTAQEMEPYYVILRLPGHSAEEFVLMLPFTTLATPNMRAWLAARSDPPSYGEMLVYRFPKDTNVFGPMQIESRIDQDPEISGSLTLWGQGGSRVIRGNLLVIPAGRSILYIEPLFLQSSENSLPELKRVIVAFEDRVVMAPTLREALRKAVGDTAKPSDATDIQALVNQAAGVFQEARERIKEGDWAGYGESMAELERILQLLVTLHHGKE